MKGFTSPFPQAQEQQYQVQGQPFQPQGQFQGQQQQQQQGQFQKPDFLNNDFMNKAKAGYDMFGALTGNAFTSKATEIFLPSESYVEKWIFNKYVRSFFDIDNMYILKKLKIILLPFIERGDWVVSVNEFSSQSQEQNYVSPKDNIHAPDLYLPLMGLITFVLVSCLSVGIGENFKPEVIQSNTTYSVLLTFVEIYLYKLLFYIVGIKNVGNLNMLSHVSYRFLSLTCILIFNLTIGGMLTFVIMVYLLGTSVFFVFKTLKRYIHTMADNFGEMNFSELSQKNVLYLMTIIQLAVSYLLLKVTGAY